MRPTLPSEIERIFPADVLQHIYKFVPYERERKVSHSPSLQKELQKIQSVTLKGKSGTYMKGLDDFCLD